MNSVILDISKDVSLLPCKNRFMRRELLTHNLLVLQHMKKAPRRSFYTRNGSSHPTNELNMKMDYWCGRRRLPQVVLKAAVVSHPPLLVSQTVVQTEPKKTQTDS